MSFKTADTNFCVKCNEVTDFYVNENNRGRLHCKRCNWALNEQAAAEAAERATPADQAPACPDHGTAEMFKDEFGTWWCEACGRGF